MAGYIGTQAVSVNTTSATISDDLAVGDDATIAGTLGVTGVVTANAGVVVDEMTLDADTLTATDTFTIDAVDDITLNCDNAGRILFGDASVIYGIASNSSSDFVLEVGTNDKDMLFKGSDNGSAVTALSLDMAAAGAAAFSSHVTVGGEVRTTLVNTASSTGTLIMFGGASNKGGTIELSGGNNTGTTGSGIVFKTGASTANPTQRMAIDLNGNVGIGIATPVDNSNVNLHVHDATSSGSSEIRLSNGSSGAAAGDGFQIQFDSAADVYLNNREAGPMIFKTSDTERMQITSGGILKIVDTELSEVSDNFSINIQSGNNDFHVRSGGTIFASFKGSAKDLELISGNLKINTIGKGIDFAATGDPSNGSNSSELLDDYEEGAFTPIFLNSGGEQMNYEFQVGFYTRVGRLVHAHGYLGGGGSFLNASGDILLGGLPYDNNAATNNFVSAHFGFGKDLNITAGHHVTGFFAPNSTNIQLKKWSSAAGTTNFTFGELSVDGELGFSVDYHV